MHLQNVGLDEDVDELRLFPDWISYIGDGSVGVETEYGSDIQISSDILLRYEDNHVVSIVESIYPDFRA
ncbi:hypothetical protein ACS0TY_033124 [Phlomoides rotata]